MDRTEAMARAKDSLAEYLGLIGVSAEDARGKGAVCPLCGSGTHKNHTGAFHIKGNRWSCFACPTDGGRIRGGDIFDLDAALNGGDANGAEVIERVYGLLGLQVDGPAYPPSVGVSEKAKAERAEADRKAREEQAEKKAEAELEAARYCAAMSGNIEQAEAVAYLAKRGIPLSLARAVGLGYDPARRRLVIPRDTGYTARAIDDGAEPKYIRAKGVSGGLFYGSEIRSCGLRAEGRAPLFVVEGELDALSLEAVGGAAVGLGGTGNVGNLLAQLDATNAELNGGADIAEARARGTADGLVWLPRFLVALDNDEAGKRAAATLLNGLTKRGYFALSVNPAELYGGEKDANAALTADGEGLKERVAKLNGTTADREREESDRARDEYRKANSTASRMPDILASFKAPRPSVPSGYARLDMLLGGDRRGERVIDAGGLPEGLIVIGALSSLGKTTFCLQAADQIAESGRDALIFSLEMSEAELVSKSISRLTYLKAREKYPRVNGGLLAKTSYGISRGNRYGFYDEAEREIIGEAVKHYSERIAPHIFIVEGKIGGTTVAEIAARVKEHTERTGAAPVVVVDYLQVIAPSEELVRATEKQQIDSNIVALKIISRDYHTPVLCVSSYSRENYTTEASVASFKGSGEIEYSADIVIALSYLQAKTAEAGGKGQNEAKAAQKELGKREEREIKLEVLKNRSGKKGELCYTFHALFNFFDEYTEEREDQERNRRIATGWR